jgi:hypothetical protein
VIDEGDYWKTTGEKLSQELEGMEEPSLLFPLGGRTFITNLIASWGGEQVRLG